MWPVLQVTTPEHFRQWRFVYGVAEGADELPQGECSFLTAAAAAVVPVNRPG